MSELPGGGEEGEAPAGRRGPRLARIAAVVVVAALAIGLGPLGGAARIQDGLKRAEPIAAAPAPPATSTANVAPGACQLRLTGAVNDCAASLGARHCLADLAASTLDVVMYYHGQHDDYLLYLQVLGLYTGPHDYLVSPWYRTDGSPGGRVTKVALRIYNSGVLYPSNDGLLAVGGAGTHLKGDVTAYLSDLIANDVPAGGTVLKVAGGWACQTGPDGP